MTTTRTITGTVRRVGDTAWAAQTVTFVLAAPFAVTGGTYPADQTTATTASDGTFTVALAVPADSADAATYQCMLPNGTTFLFNLSAGIGAVTLESLFVEAFTAEDANALQVLLDDYDAALPDRVEDILVAGSNVTVTRFGDTVVIAATGGGGGGGAPTDATYVTLSLNGTLTGERVLTAGDNVTLTDNGAGGTVVIAAPSIPWADVASTPTTLGGYGITDAASDAELTAHEADTTNVHGIANTATLVLTNDNRLSDARTPTAHASSHAAAGSDPLTLTQVQVTSLVSDLAAKAPLASPALTGTPAAPTASAGTNTTQLATTAFATGGLATHEADTTNVHGIADTAALLTTSTAAGGVLGGTYPNLTFAADMATQAELNTEASTRASADSALDTRVDTLELAPPAHAASHASGGSDAVTLAQSQVTNLVGDLAAKAPLASPALTGTPTAPTASAGASTTQVATTAFATGGLATHEADTTAVHGIADTAALVLTNDSRLSDSRTPTAHAASHASGGGDPLTLAQSQITSLVSDLAAKAALASPTFTGTPAAPTATAGTNTTQLATTAFTTGAVADHSADTTAVHGIADTAALVLTNDSRLTDARTPTAHATTHSSGNSDPITHNNLAGLTTGDPHTQYALKIDSGYPVNSDTTVYYAVPSPAGSVANNTGTLPASSLEYEPFVVTTARTADRIAINVTSAAVAGKLIRLGIYQADANWQPTSLVVDSGTMAVDSTGIKSATISVTLAPGRYLKAKLTDGAPTCRFWYVPTPGGMWLTTAAGASSSIGFLYRTGVALAAFPSTGTTWNLVAGDQFGFQHFVFLRFSA